MNPINTGNRVRVIDVIRGFCLLGILIANMLTFQYGMYGLDNMSLFNPTSLDTIAYQVLNITVVGSFVPIFMFLFGYSLYKLRESLVNRSLKPKWPLVRRFLMLIILGVIHSLLLWEGDILAFYGGVGFLLLLFVKRKPKTLIIWGILLSLVIPGLSYNTNNMTATEETQIQAYVTKSIEIYGKGTYSEISKFRLTEDPLGLPPGAMIILLIFIAPIVMIPTFLFGIAAAKKEWFHNSRCERRRYIWGTATLLPLGLGFKSIAILQPDSPWSGVLLAAGGQMLALGYISALALILSYLSNGSLLVSAFEAIGRMSITNYLMQTVICTTIFYGYGLGWFGQISILNGFLLALLIYSVQAVLTTLLFRWFKNGPFERILRMWTYFSRDGKPRASRKVVNDPTLNTSV
ncbi:DUF418 domain-containing protein [Paenibacillus antarcticus]|uniref:DUF418 domain-containing protein n=1 Tax=Paenibacillus antarcticus TaxID=253703 RepID=UPI001FE43311|nr:DUF418 domain-containing protein [Paenibacillus antarcticus]